MGYNRDNDLSDRRSAGSVARAALLTAYRTAKDAAGPEQAARQAERQAIAAAREDRRAERERLKAEEQARLHAEAEERQAAADAAARAEAEASEAAEKSRIAWLIKDEAARKAERDRRYTARKAGNHNTFANRLPLVRPCQSTSSSNDIYSKHAWRDHGDFLRNSIRQLLP